MSAHLVGVFLVDVVFDCLETQLVEVMGFDLDQVRYLRLFVVSFVYLRP